MAGHDLVVVAVAVESEWDAVYHLLKTRRITFPVGFDRGNSLQRTFRFSGVPVTYLVDRAGQLTEVLDPLDLRLEKVIAGPREWDLPHVVAAYRRRAALQ